MRLAMRLTTDGLIRALRGRAHGLADRIEAGYRSPARPRGRPARTRPTPQTKRTERDEFAGR